MSTPTGREKLAALQAQQARAVRQKKLLAITSAAVVVVLAVVAVFYFVGKNKQDSDDKQAVANSKDKGYLDVIQHIPSKTYDAVGAGAQSNTAPQAVSGKALTKNGKPEVLYIGAEFCPYCGMQRWALTAALSRFGTFSGLSTDVSAATDNPPNIPTMTYVHAKYTSKYLTFTAFETADRDRNPLQTPDAASKALFDKYNSKSTIPFIDYGGRAGYVGANFEGANYMSNVSGNTVADKLKDPNSTESQGILGTANTITAQLCQLTKQQPANVCGSIGVAKAVALHH